MNKVDFNNLHNECYIDKSKKLVKFIPELDIKIQKYNEKIWKNKFPQDITQDLKLSKLQLTNIGMYSIATPAISNELINVIKDAYSYMIATNSKTEIKDIKDLSITETNGGLGGFSIRLAQHFNKLNIVEINNKHADIIKNNLKVYKLDSDKKNINIHVNDYLNIMYELENDIIICDPPWGGYNYVKQKSIKLGMSNINIICVINEVIKKKLCKIFIMLSPKNYDIQDFLTNINSDKILVRKLSKHYFISIFIEN